MAKSSNSESCTKHVSLEEGKTARGRSDMRLFRPRLLFRNGCVSLRSAQQSLFPQFYEMVNGLTLLLRREDLGIKGVSTRPMVGSVDTECPALVKRLMC